MLFYIFAWVLMRHKSLNPELKCGITWGGGGNLSEYLCFNACIKVTFHAAIHYKELR